MNNIHPTAIIEDNVILGDGNEIGAFVHIGAVGGVKGETQRKGKIIIGDNNRIASGTHIESPVRTNETKIGNNNFIFQNVYIAHDCKILSRNVICAGVSIGGSVTILNDNKIGMNAAIKQRINIGEKAEIGMSAAVVEDVSSNITVKGVPAK